MPSDLESKLDELIKERCEIYAHRSCGVPYDPIRLQTLHEMIDAFWLTERMTLQRRIEELEKTVARFTTKPLNPRDRMG